MWTYGVVATPPGFDENPVFSQGVENLSVQELVAQPRVETPDVSVLPGRTWLDESGSGADRGGLLPERIQAGMPRRMKRSVRTSMTSTEESFLRTRIARLSRVSSSRTLRVRKARPSWVR